MIALKNKPPLRILALGLRPEEEVSLHDIARETSAALKFAYEDLELWSAARSGAFDVYIIGQHSKVPEPSYLIWLLKGITSQSKLILIYTNINEEEAARLERFHTTHVLTRPIKKEDLFERIEECAYPEEPRLTNRFWRITHNLIPVWKAKKVS